MRSAFYYPRTQVQSRPLMQSSLLLWDRLYTIVPSSNYRPDYRGRPDMAEAWELVGTPHVPTQLQKSRAHSAIETTLRAGLSPNLYYADRVDHPDDTYEVWPEKFSRETWELLREHRVTARPLLNGDYPFTQEGGLLVMAKLADACAGLKFARVTDRLMAYGLIGSGDKRPGMETDVIPIALDLIDASSIPLANLVKLRKREQSERNGADYTKLRHNYANLFQSQIKALSEASDQFERDELIRQFRSDMEFDLKDLRRELGLNKISFYLKPAVLAIGAGASFYSGSPNLAAALAVMGFGEIASKVAEFLNAGLNFNQKQRELMLKHPMAYMYALSSVR